MENADYKLTLSPLIDTVFVLEIGGVYADVDKNEDTLENVHTTAQGIHIRLELGGTVGADWSLEVTVDKDDDTYQTIPKTIKGKISAGGGSWIDRTFPLKKNAD